MRPERLDLRPERLDLRPERLDLGTERLDLRPERLDLRPEGPDEGGGTDKRTNEQTNESPPVFYRTSSPSGPLPKKAMSTLTDLLIGCYAPLHLTLLVGWSVGHCSFLGRGPKGADDRCFYTEGKFFLLLRPLPSTSKLIP